MKKNKVKKLTNLIILDASGSMQSKTNEVRGGLKTLLEQIKSDATRDDGEVKTATIVTDFSSHGDFQVVVNEKDSVNVNTGHADRYTTRGMTALYDAIYKSFDLVSSDQDSVFVTIFTDGGENDSKEITYEGIKSLIGNRKEKNWVITFMGTTEADLKNAESLGISKGNTMMFANTSTGVMDSMSSLVSARTAYYMANTSSTSDVDLNNLMDQTKTTTNKQ